MLYPIKTFFHLKCFQQRWEFNHHVRIQDIIQYYHARLIKRLPFWIHNPILKCQNCLLASLMRSNYLNLILLNKWSDHHGLLKSTGCEDLSNLQQWLTLQRSWQSLFGWGVSRRFCWWVLSSQLHDPIQQWVMNFLP